MPSCASVAARARALRGACAHACAGLALAAALPLGARAQSAVTTLIVRADTLWEAGRTDTAAVLYRAALADDSLATPRAVLRVAIAFSWANQTDSALRYFARYARMEPGDYRGPLGRARTLAWASRHGAALATLDSLAAALPSAREVALFRAQVLAWAGDLAGAKAQYRAWLTAHADDDEARAGLARTLTWDGRFDDAATEYRSLEARLPAEAAKGIARVTAWRGDLVAAHAQWAQVTERYPLDPEGWVGLAQVSRWQGRALDADRALAQALVVSPGYADAISQRVWVRADLAPAGDVLTAYTNDSDQNRMLTVATSAAATPPWPGRLTATVQTRRAEFSAYTGTSTAVRAVASWAPGGTAWTFAVDAGVTVQGDNASTFLAPGGAGAPGGRPLASDRPSALFAYGLRATGPVAAGVVGSIGVAGGAFDETAVLIVRRIRTDGVDGDLTATLPGRFTLSAGAGWATIGNGSSPNRRLMFNGALRYTLSRGSWIGALARTFAYDTSAGADGYFAPQRFTLFEAAAHFELPRDIGWNVLADAGLGSQAIRIGGASDEAKGAQRAQLGVLYRPTPGTELLGSVWIANVASPFATTADYRAGGITLRGRLRF